MAQQNDQIVEIEMPSGEVLEFPADTPQEQMREAARQYFAQTSGMAQQPQAQSTGGGTIQSWPDVGQYALQQGKAAAEEGIEGLKDRNLWEDIKRYGIKGPVAGTAKLARNIVDLPASALNWLVDVTPAGKRAGPGRALQTTGITDEDIYQALGLPPAEEQNIGDVISQIIPDIAGAVAVPEAQLGRVGQALEKAPGLLGKILPQTAQTAATQALYGAAASPEGEKQKGALISGALAAPFSAGAQIAQTTPSAALRGAAAAGLGLGGGALGYEAAGGGIPGGILGSILGAAGYRGSATPPMKMGQQIKGIDVTQPRVQERLAEAQRLGVNITPAEAAESPFLGREHAKLGRSMEGSRKAYEKARERIGQEEKSINKLLDTIYEPAQLDETVRAGYREAYPQQVPLEIPAKFSDNKSIQRIDKQIRRDPEILESLEKSGADLHTSIGYWDVVKRILDKDIERFSLPTAKSVDKTKLSALKDLNRDLVNSLEGVSQPYTEAKSLSQRKISRDKIEKAFDKQEMNTGEALYKTLESKTKFNELINMLDDVPQAQQMLRDMKDIFKDSRKLPKISTSAGLEATGMFQDRATPKALIKLIDQKLLGGGKFDEAALDFIHSGKWQEQMNEINKISNAQARIGAFMGLIGRSTGGASRGIEDSRS